jgi:hypothetical protein
VLAVWREMAWRDHGVHERSHRFGTTPSRQQRMETIESLSQHASKGSPPSRRVVVLAAQRPNRFFTLRLGVTGWPHLERAYQLTKSIHAAIDRYRHPTELELCDSNQSVFQSYHSEELRPSEPEAKRPSYLDSLGTENEATQCLNKQEHANARNHGYHRVAN